MGDIPAVNCTSQVATETESGLIFKGTTQIKIEKFLAAGANGEDVLQFTYLETDTTEALGFSLVAGSGIAINETIDEDTEQPVFEIVNTCSCERLEGTYGCDYPADPAIDDLHLNGGDQGWLEEWNGTNWVRVCPEAGTLFYSTTENNWPVVFQHGGACNNWTDSTVYQTETLNGLRPNETQDPDAEGSEPTDFSFCGAPEFTGGDGANIALLGCNGNVAEGEAPGQKLVLDEVNDAFGNLEGYWVTPAP